MKNKFNTIVVIIALVFVIVATAVISNRITMKYAGKTIARQAEELATVIEDNSVKKVVVDPVNYDSLRAEIEAEMRKEFEGSHQNPEHNEKYDKQVSEYVDFDIDPLPKAFKEILNRTEKVVSMDYAFKDMRVEDGYKIKAKFSYHYPHLDNPPYLEIDIKDIDHIAKTRLKFDVMVYLGFNSLSISGGYEPFRWLRVGIILNGQKIYIDGSEKLIINPLIGVGINF